MKSYLTLIRHIFPYKSLIVWFVVFSILTVIFSLVSIVMLVPFLELLFDKTPLVTEMPAFSFSKEYFVETFYYYLSQKIVTTGKVSALAFFCVVVSMVFLLKNLFRYLALYVLAPLRNRLIYDLRDKMYSHLLKLPISFFKKNEKGNLLTMFTNDLTEIEYSVMNTLETSIQSPLNIIVFLGAMLVMSAKLTLFVFGMILVMALVIGRIGKSLKKESKEAKNVLGKLTSIIDETISGIKIIQAYSIQSWIHKKFTTENKDYYKTYNRMYRKRDLSSPLTEFLAIVVICIVLWYGGNLVLSGGSLTPPTFIAFMVVFSQLIPPAKSFSSAFYEIKKGMASYERIQTILSSEQVEENIHATEKVEFKDSIKFQDVSFRYEGAERNAIEDFSFEFKKGKKYALIGESGAGKSTLFDILLEFYRDYTGQISIDVKDINALNLQEYRSLFGIVPQEAVLFNFGIDENIGFDNIEKNKVEKSLEIANATTFANNLKGKKIGEKGAKLSGGERQRLSIARVAYRDPEIVLLDEATSALDSKNESEVKSALDNLLKSKTSIIIAHRLSTIQDVDEILLMQDGKLIAHGTHSELYGNSAIYKSMVDMQKFG